MALRQLNTLARDVRFSIRGLRKSPGFTAVAVLSLALGLGATTALFSLVDALLLRPLPVAEPERLVFIQRTASASGKPMLLDRVALDTLGTARDLLAGVAAAVPLNRASVVIDGIAEPDRVVMQATADLFAVLGVRPAAGRLDLPADSAPVAVISARFWRARFDARPDVAGASIAVNGQSYAIAGVTPAKFLGLSPDASVDVWLVSPTLTGAATSAIARLQHGATLSQAHAAVTAALDQSRNQTAAVGPIVTEVSSAARGTSGLRDQYREPLVALLALVALVLVVTCANLGNLLVVRNVRRRHELAVRRALGAGRSRLAAQLLIESGVIALIGGIAAYFVAGWVVAAILARLPLSAIPGQLQLALNLRIAGFMAAISLVCATLFAILPAWRATRVDPAPALKGTSATATSRDGRRLGLWLVGGQVALSVILVVAAGLFLQTLRNMSDADLGYDAKNLLEVELDRRVRIPPADVPAMYDRLVDAVSRVPGVASVTMANPLFPAWTRGMSQPAEYSAGPIGLRYFETLGIPLVRGRLFTDDDARRTVGVSIVNESYAREVFPGENPIGKRAGYNNLEVVGVVADVRTDNLRWRNQSIAYRLSINEGRLLPAILVRTNVAPASVSGAVRAAVNGVQPRLIESVHTVEQAIDASIPRERLVAFTGSAFGLLGLVLAGIGLFGVAALAVAQRTREIAIQRALGATGWNVVQVTIRQTAVVLAVGLAAGSIVASIGARIGQHQISGLLFGVEATDWTNLAAANVVLIAVALAACLVPALRATRVDPLTAIRHE